MGTVWRWLISLVAVAALVLAVASYITANSDGTFGITFGAQGPIGHTSAVAVAPGSPAARAGIHAGDRLTIAPTAANLARQVVPEAGDRLVLRDGNREIRLVADPLRGSPLALVILVYASRAAFLFMALLVIWRRPNDAAAQALALFLAIFGFFLGFDAGTFSQPWLRLLLATLMQTFFFVGTMAALAFACRFPVTPTRGVRHALERSLVPAALVGVMLSTLSIYLRLPNGSGGGLQRFIALLYLVYFAIAIVAVVVALFSALRETSGADQLRVRWVFGIFGFGFSGLVIFLLFAFFGFASSGPIQFTPLTLLAIPLGLAYVVLRHRMLDIGFVVNRAVVYTTVSLIVVATFIIFEWLAGHLVDSQNRASSMLQLGAALALGLSARWIHARVDRWVDDLFFRERHAAEAAIRKFAREAALVTNTEDLLHGTVEIPQRNLRLAACAVYVHQEGEYRPAYSTFAGAPNVGENDFAVLDMRTWHGPVEPRTFQTTLPGELALPMIVRGELTGFLLCAEKASHETFAPDEREALALLARDAGIALDSLRVRALEMRLAQLLPATTAGEARN